MDKRTSRLELWLLSTAAALLAGCATPPPPVLAPPAPPRPAPPPPPAPAPLPPAPVAVAPSAGATSSATTALAYRKDAASHLYSKNSPRIMKGKMPPMLYAVGVLEVEVGPRGEMLATSWRRAPSHAPEVVREIEQMVRDAAPFPAPVHMGRVTYTDVWLWDKSGKFQLDTLTEGQN